MEMCESESFLCRPFEDPKIHTDSVADKVFATLDPCKNFGDQKSFIKMALSGQQRPSTFSPALKYLINSLQNGKLESYSF